MNPLIQEEKTGCGVTSVAAIVGVSYPLAQTARCVARHPGFGSSPGSDTDHVRGLLAQFDWTAAPTEMPFASGTRCQSPLLAINGISEEQD